LPNNIFGIDIGFVINISIVPFDISSEKDLMQIEGIIIISNHGDISKNEFKSIKLDFIKL
tara:strand:- start:1333 stop:1512 length:180 start_codon:yes stop_codon:yes gene_type:complete